MKVKCDIYQGRQEGDYGGEVGVTEARCERCDHQTESFGTDEPSVLRCLVLMREECPFGESNFYFQDDIDF